MSDYEPNPHGWKMDRIRHQDPKLKKKLRGVGGRKAQVEYLGGVEGMDAIASNSQEAYTKRGQGRQFSSHISDEQFERLRRLRGTVKQQDFITLLLDAYESQSMNGLPPRVPFAPIRHEEAIKKLGEEQTRLHLPTIESTVDRLIEMAKAAERRAVKILEQEGQIRNLEHQWRSTKEQLDAATSRLSEATKEPAVRQVDDETAQGVLFNFVSAFTGTHAVASPSGQTVIEIPGRQAQALFAAWSAATAVLGLAKE